MTAGHNMVLYYVSLLYMISNATLFLGATLVLFFLELSGFTFHLISLFSVCGVSPGPMLRIRRNYHMKFLYIHLCYFVQIQRDEGRKEMLNNEVFKCKRVQPWPWHGNGKSPQHWLRCTEVGLVSKNSLWMITGIPLACWKAWSACWLLLVVGNSGKDDGGSGIMRGKLFL